MSNRQWYYAQNNQQLGPVSEAELVNLFSNNKLPLTALVWSEHLSAWTAAKDLEQFAKLGPAQPPPPIPAPGAPPPLPQRTTTGQRNQQSSAPPPPPAGQPSFMAQAWLRYFARFSDHLIYSFLGFAVAFTIFWAAFFFFGMSVNVEPWLRSGRPMTPALICAFFTGLLTYTALEPVFIACLATTPGKLLFGIRMWKDGQDGRKPDIGQSMLRTLEVWVKGGPLSFLLGWVLLPFFPAVSLVLMLLGGLICTGLQIFQFLQFKKNGRTSWDRNGRCEFAQVKGLHKAIVGGALLATFILGSATMGIMYYVADTKNTAQQEEHMKMYLRDRQR